MTVYSKSNRSAMSYREPYEVKGGRPYPDEVRLYGSYPGRQGENSISARLVCVKDIKGSVLLRNEVEP